MQEGTKDRRGRSHPPQCTTSREIGLSARGPLLDLPLTQNHRRLHRQWCDAKSTWAAEWKEVVFTDESRICLQHRDGPIRVWRHRGERMLNNCVMAHQTGPTLGIMVLGRYCISLLHSSGMHYRYFKQPALHLRGVGASCSSLLSGLGPSHISKEQYATTRDMNCPKDLRQSPDIELLPLSGFFTDRKHVVNGCSTIDPTYNPNCHTRSSLVTCGSCLVCCTP
ncbi:transposable element Tcb1 transposase [Trichonephila clavipes]|nr:transposable element Tcb1 transposase [Trichonephila clavipes]